MKQQAALVLSGKVETPPRTPAEVENQVAKKKEALSSQKKLYDEQQNEIEILKIKNKLKGKQLMTARLVALLVLLCFGIQIYSNFGWAAYYKPHTDALLEKLRPENVSAAVSDKAARAKDKIVNTSNDTYNWAWGKYNQKKSSKPGVSVEVDGSVP